MDATLKQYNNKAGSVLYFGLKPSQRGSVLNHCPINVSMQIVVKLSTGKSITIDARPNNSISDVKYSVPTKGGILPGQ